MTKKLVVGVIALLIFLGVGYLMAESNRTSALRTAEAGRNQCLAERGYFGADTVGAPDDVARECGRYFREYSEGETMRYVYGGLVGLAAALLFLVLAWFFMFRRQPAAAPPPPAG